MISPLLYANKWRTYVKRLFTAQECILSSVHAAYRSISQLSYEAIQKPLKAYVARSTSSFSLPEECYFAQKVTSWYSLLHLDAKIEEGWSMFSGLFSRYIMTKLKVRNVIRHRPTLACGHRMTRSNSKHDSRVLRLEGLDFLFCRNSEPWLDRQNSTPCFVRRTPFFVQQQKQ